MGRRTGRGDGIHRARYYPVWLRPNQAAHVMSWHDWKDHGIEPQFNPRLAVGDAAESWLNGWAEQSLRRQVELSLIHI